MPAADVAWASSSDHNGGSPILFQHLFWFFGHPEVYIVALPAFGIVSDLLCDARAQEHLRLPDDGLGDRRDRRRCRFVVWAHHMYVSGMNPYFGFFFATTTLIIAVPTAIKVYNWVLTLWRGDIHLTVPMLFAIGFIFTFVHGGLTGLFLGNVTVDLPLSDTYFVVGHFHMVMGVSPILVRVRRDLSLVPEDHRAGCRTRRSASIHFWMTFLGTYAIYLPMHYLGILGVPRRYYALRQHGVHPAVGARGERGDHDRRDRRRDGAGDLPVSTCSTSLRKGKKARSESLERDDARVADAATRRRMHGNWGPKLPVVYRWAYDYSVPGEAKDFIPQNEPPKGHRTLAGERDHGVHALSIPAMIIALARRQSPSGGCSCSG